MVHIIMKDCRMKLGKPLIYDHSGENNLTRGIEMKLVLKVDFDNNGFCIALHCTGVAGSPTPL